MEHALTAVGLATSSPAFAAALLGQQHFLHAADLQTSSFTYSALILRQLHNFASFGVTVTGPVINSTVLGYNYLLVAEPLYVGPPLIDIALVEGIVVLPLNIIVEARAGYFAPYRFAASEQPHYLQARGAPLNAQPLSVRRTSHDDVVARKITASKSTVAKQQESLAISQIGLAKNTTSWRQTYTATARKQ